MRKVLLFGIVTVALVVLGFVVITLGYGKRYQNTNAIKGVPVNAMALVQVSNLKSLHQLVEKDIAYSEELSLFKPFSKYLDLLRQIDSVGIYNKGEIQSLLNRPVVVSMHEQGKHEVENLYSIALSNKAEEHQLIEWLEEVVGQEYGISSKKYDASTIYKIEDEKSQSEYYLSVYRGVAVASASNLLVESAVRQIQQEESLLHDPLFQKVYKTSSRSSVANVYLNLEKTQKQMRTSFIQQKDSPPLYPLTGSKWVELDVDLESKNVQMNGFLSSENHGLIKDIFVGMQSQKTQIHEVLPSNTSVYISFAIESPGELQKRFHAYLQHVSMETSYWPFIEKLKRQYGIDWDAGFFSLIEDEMALVYATRNPMNKKDNVFLVVKTKGQSYTKGKLNEFHRAISNGKPLEPDHVYHLDEAISFPIYKGLPNDMIQHVAGQFFGKVPQAYFSFYNNYLVFSNNSKSLQAYLYANVLSKTLSNQKHFERFRENFSVKENVFVYGELGALPGHLNGIVDKKLVEFNEDQSRALDNFYAGGLQIAATGGLLYANACINYLPSRDDEPQTVWQSHMDSTVVMKPVLVKNHNTSEREILIQDAAHNLYLINTSGRILWKKALDGPVMGEIVQIDFYRNNKLQYLFNTKERIYLIDRNGNSVDRYPVKLPSRASNALSVFDYDNNRNYRIFIATEDKKISLLDKRANRITGWTFSNTEGSVSQPVQHFRTNSKDYIVFADEYRTYILDRRGNQRIKPDKRFLVNDKSRFYLKGQDSSNSELITSSTSGEIVAIGLPSGMTRIVSAGETVMKDHTFAFFEINQSPRYVFLTDQDLLVLGSKGRTVFSREFDRIMSSSIDLYQFSANNIKLGLVEKNGGQIYLLNADGTDYRGFPLKGSSRYSIGFLKKSSRQFNLLVGGDNNYLYNYIVE